VAVAVALACMACLTGCGSVSSISTPPPSLSVSVQPGSASLFLGQSQQFSATVTGSANTLVNWSVNGIAGGNATAGTITIAGLYTAPRILPAPAIVSITATSQADPTKNDTAAVSIKSDVALSLAPNSANLVPGASQVFTVSMTASGNPDTSVTWSVNGIAGGNATLGTISPAGSNSATYTAPATIPSPPTVNVKATSAADPSAVANAGVNILCSSNSISPATASAAVGQSQSFTAILCVPPGTQITWDVNGIIGGSPIVGTITNTGTNLATYIAPNSLPPSNPVTIRAASQSNPSQSATATVTISANISVTVTPSSARVSVGQRAAFSAIVANATNTAVNWTVNGIVNGDTTVGLICLLGSSPCAAPQAAISGSVDFLAPAVVPSPSVVTLVATSEVAPSVFGSAQVIIAPPASVSISVSPGFAFLPPAGQPGSTRQFFASVIGSSNTGVAWSISSAVAGQGCSGSSCGTISSAGLYTAPASAPSPNAIAVTAISLADPSQSASATVAITDGPTIETLLPSSVMAGVADSFTLAVGGLNYFPGSGSSASVILLGGTPRATVCPSSNRCTTTLQPSDAGAAATFLVQVQNPGSPQRLSNPVPFVIVPFSIAEEVISLSASLPVASDKDIVVFEPTTAGTTPSQINVDFAGLLIGDSVCTIQGLPLFVTRPASGTATISLCVHGNTLDPSFTYELSGPSSNDISVSASAISGGFPNTIRLDLIISNATVPGPRTLLITTTNHDRAAATGFLEVN
jgi:hypothetical protein